MKYHYRIMCVGGMSTTFDTDELVEFDVNAPSISINNEEQQMKTVINVRNVVMIERTLNKEG